MKTLLLKLTLICSSALLFSFGKAQDQGWPRVITASDGTVIRVYEPEPESFAGNNLKFRSAISVTANGGTEPIFGTFWCQSRVETDRNSRQVTLSSAQISDIKIPAETDQGRIDFIRSTLESQLPQATGPISLDELLSSLEQNLEEAKLSQNISTVPPKIIYTTQPSILVLIDGTPKLQRNNDWGVDVVVNTPFTIVKNTDGNFYLYGDHHWYTAPAATGPYSFAGSGVPDNLAQIESALNANNNNNNPDINPSGVNQPPVNPDGTVSGSGASNIIVSTVPAELIQSNGEPNFSPIEGTSLLYMKNSSNDIFMDVNSQLYYVLISGRWYRTHALNGNQWQYIPADKLPADFAKIPEGSSKDNVLASVAGTDAAKEAVMDAQIPQTAKVDRRTATTNVTYNGNPEFKPISGTELEYAVNSSSTVLRYHGQYYVVDNGVWFVSNYPSGPWSVSTERPEDVDRIPPDNPDYNAKYVYVYDSNPDYVYMGYTPGYLGSYVYGPTVVYGTGFYYNPWWGPYYYPRPWSWGFGFGYNPWWGWSFGFGYSFGWFNIGFGYQWGGWHGGWWGPPVYHPAFCGWHAGYHGYGGFYGRNVTFNRTYINNHVTVNNNIYVNRGGIATRDNNRYASSRPLNGNRGGNFGRPANYTPNGGRSEQPGYPRPANSNVFSDRQGNVYQRNTTGQWQQRANRQWNPVSTMQHPEVVQNLNRQQQMRDRGQVRSQNFQSARSFAPARSGGGMSRPSGGGGGGRSPGGGGGHRR
jgi:hypothetical protein